MALLEIEQLSVNYGAIQAVRGISLHVDEGEVVTLIGANGAGKTTTLRAVSRMMRPVSGRITFAGRDITRIPADEAVKIGIAQSPEGRQVLARQSVQDNLELGAYTRREQSEVKSDIGRMYERFPRLGERRHQLAGTLSGGEQQMLAIARAMMSRPRLLLLDEPSLGLAPIIVREIFSIIRELNEQGTTILLVEQNAKLAMNSSNRTYVLEAGQMTFTGESAQLVNDERVLHAYLGG
ncbi:ABC transporter ATP-binding protein [Deinococcus malanensis]|uniref:ABC transporter ATP-binding protein n=1 Tax=Deinococcus malanensis TaxID=1706855 RepID=A0ABQ2EI17_9DEIO|nr:ABC transporter ATP-binding protein [Deinococcus malanensis]GGK12328.1 ABC transporter ATP-binding protein [Deinococcus malanensis]